MTSSFTQRAAGLVGVLVALCLLGACGEAVEPGTGTPDAATPGIADGDYRSVEVTGHDLVPGTVVRLGWDGGEVRVQAGCNSLSGTAVLESGRLRVPDLAGTEMGCAPGLMDQDAWLSAFLGAGPELTMTANGDGFTLRDGTAALRFAPEQPVDDLPLEGTTWELESVVKGDAVTSGPVGPDSPVASAGGIAWLRVSEGRLRAHDGCNRLAGPVEVTGDTLSAGPLASTRRACPDPATAETAHLLGELLQESTYAVAGETLTLRRGPVTLVLRALP